MVRFFSLFFWSWFCEVLILILIFWALCSARIYQSRNELTRHEKFHHRRKTRFVMARHNDLPLFSCFPFCFPCRALPAKAKSPSKAAVSGSISVGTARNPSSLTPDSSNPSSSDQLFSSIASEPTGGWGIPRCHQLDGFHWSGSRTDHPSSLTPHSDLTAEQAWSPSSLPPMYCRLRAGQAGGPFSPHQNKAVVSSPVYKTNSSTPDHWNPWSLPESRASDISFQQTISTSPHDSPFDGNRCGLKRDSSPYNMAFLTQGQPMTTQPTLCPKTMDTNPSMAFRFQQDYPRNSYITQANQDIAQIVTTNHDNHAPRSHYAPSLGMLNTFPTDGTNLGQSSTVVNNSQRNSHYRLQSNAYHEYPTLTTTNTLETVRRRPSMLLPSRLSLLGDDRWEGWNMTARAGCVADTQTGYEGCDAHVAIPGIEVEIVVILTGASLLVLLLLESLYEYAINLFDLLHVLLCYSTRKGLFEGRLFLIPGRPSSSTSTPGYPIGNKTGCVLFDLERLFESKTSFLAMIAKNSSSASTPG